MLQRDAYVKAIYAEKGSGLGWFALISNMVIPANGRQVDNNLAVLLVGSVSHHYSVFNCSLRTDKGVFDERLGKYGIYNISESFGLIVIGLPMRILEGAMALGLRQVEEGFCDETERGVLRTINGGDNVTHNQAINDKKQMRLNDTENSAYWAHRILGKWSICNYNIAELGKVQGEYTLISSFILDYCGMVVGHVCPNVRNNHDVMLLQFSANALLSAIPFQLRLKRISNRVLTWNLVWTLELIPCLVFPSSLAGDSPIGNSLVNYIIEAQNLQIGTVIQTYVVFIINILVLGIMLVKTASMLQYFTPKYLVLCFCPVSLKI